MQILYSGMRGRENDMDALIICIDTGDRCGWRECADAGAARSRGSTAGLFGLN
jgi:hypothetical protein